MGGGHGAKAAPCVFALREERVVEIEDDGLNKDIRFGNFNATNIQLVAGIPPFKVRANSAAADKFRSRLAKALDFS